MLSGFMQAAWVWDWLKLKTALIAMEGMYTFAMFLGLLKTHGSKEQIHSPPPRNNVALDTLKHISGWLLMNLAEHVIDEGLHSLHYGDHSDWLPCPDGEPFMHLLQSFLKNEWTIVLISRWECENSGSVQSDVLAFGRAMTTTSDSQASRTWNDGVDFRPSKKVVKTLMSPFI